MESLKSYFRWLSLRMTEIGITAKSTKGTPAGNAWWGGFYVILKVLAICEVWHSLSEPACFVRASFTGI